VATKENNSNWSEAEGLLLLDLFMRLGGRGVSANTKEIRELSELLNSPGFRPPGAPDTYRNPIGVAMQYGCLTSLDGSARAGFKPSKLLVRLWNHYQGKEGELAERAAALLAVTAGETHAWMFYMASDERRSWQSNRGYDDAPGKYYSYDSNVRRAAQVKAGDIAVIRHDDYVVGYGVVDEVRSWADQKWIGRCPECATTDWYARSTKSPPLRCSKCKHEFFEPDGTFEKVTAYQASYEETWRELTEAIPHKDLDEAQLMTDVMNAIRPLDHSKVAAILTASELVDWGHWVDRSRHRVTKIVGGHTTGSSKRRIGQDKFRKALLERYGEVCAISGKQPVRVLDAAHLYPFADDPKHDIHGGLLLRRDLHRLFDDHLLVVDPDSWTVHVSPALKDYPGYARLEGVPLRVAADKRPKASYLHEHRAQAGWA